MWKPGILRIGHQLNEGNGTSYTDDKMKNLSTPFLRLRTKGTNETHPFDQTENVDGSILPDNIINRHVHQFLRWLEEYFAGIGFDLERGMSAEKYAYG
jgi:hypothetical protein